MDDEFDSLDNKKDPFEGKSMSDVIREKRE